MWAFSLVASVGLHVAAGVALILPWAGMLQSVAPPPPIDLSIAVIPPEVIEPDTAPATAEEDADPEALTPEPAEELAALEPEAEQIEDVPPEPAEAVEPEEAEVVEPEEAEAVEPEETEAVEPEEAEPVEPAEPEPAEPVAPEPAAPVAPAAAVPATPVAPAAPVAAAPIAAAPVAAAPVAAAPVSVLRAEPGDGGGGGGVVAAAPVVASPVTANPAVVSTALPQAPVVVGAIPPPPPPPAPRPAASAASAPGAGAPETPTGELIRRIRGELAVPCLVALPRANADGTLSLDYIAANEADVIAFADRLMTGAAARPAERTILVDPRQCPALNYVRTATRYPGSPIGLGIAARTVADGGNLQGALRNAGGRYVSLLLIDADGVVQDMGGFMSFAGAVVQFDAPVRRDGPARDTAQLVLALATDTRPPALDTHIGRLAEEFFPALAQTAGPSTLMALETFVVE
jgi:hypothetical protein